VTTCDLYTPRAQTGRKPVHTGINVWIPNAAYGLPLNESTLANVLNARGFRSHAVGKWVSHYLLLTFAN
jgi:arylsulfatase A-like enzyme